MVVKIRIFIHYYQIIIMGDLVKKVKKIIPNNTLIQNDEYFYRDPEMFRANIDDDQFDLNEFVLEDKNKK